MSFVTSLVLLYLMNAVCLTDFYIFTSDLDYNIADEPLLAYTELMLIFKMLSRINAPLLLHLVLLFFSFFFF